MVRVIRDAGHAVRRFLEAYDASVENAGPTR